MMKNTKLLIALAASLLLSLGVAFAGAAKTTSAPAAQKIAVIDMNKVVYESKQFDTLKKTLKKKFDPRNAEIVKAQEQLKSSIAKLKRDGSIMKKSARTKLEDDILAQQKSLHAQQVSFQKDLYQAQNKGMAKILKALKPKIEKVSRQKGFQLVLTKANAPFFVSEVDITSAVSEAFSRR